MSLGEPSSDNGALPPAPPTNNRESGLDHNNGPTSPTAVDDDPQVRDVLASEVVLRTGAPPQEDFHSQFRVGWNHNDAWEVEAKYCLN